MPEAPKAAKEQVSVDGPRAPQAVPVPTFHPLAQVVAACNPKPGDLVIVASEHAKPGDIIPAPAGVQVLILPHLDVVRYNAEDMYRLGWVRRKA